jgi:hypothetical protein
MGTRLETAAPLSDSELARLDAYWRAANYLTVGQIYLLDNPLLREPLRAEHVKPRLLGHWGTSPGLSLLYAHLNRAITARDLNAIYVTGPGHGGPPSWPTPGSRCCTGTATSPIWWKATNPRRCTNCWRRRWTGRWTRSPASSGTPAPPVA